jgi:tetratricopeptide (TPR) repeat protein
MTSIRTATVVLLLALGTAGIGRAQPAVGGEPPATVREYRKVMRTYPFSDPNPIATMGRIYPYFRFDGYTDVAEDREWTVVELENAYLKVIVMPEIGGKIWTAIDKRSGRPFIYDNEVVKFRDIAMRGPWTSGGIEPNYGIIGHTPNCATPVDYAWHANDDGSASVVIGVLDLLTRTPWRLEIRLPRDAAYFTTRSFWYNATPVEQPYYTWMNAGIKAAGNLQLIFPGSNFIGHNGEVGSWPSRPEDGRDLSFYDRNDFGSYKSYHVLGTRTDVFGAYWHDEGFGMGRYARRDDKPGKKIWIWGLSDQGMIWETLLTDRNGQYVEVQSGRLFNQAAEGSTLTPFKHRGFPPHTTDTWTEYWFPVHDTGGFVTANEFGAINVRAGETGVVVSVSPLQHVTDRLEVLDGDTVVFSQPIRSVPTRAWTVETGVKVAPERLRVRLPAHRLDVVLPGRPETVLSRPLVAPPDFNWQSAYGRWLKGKELVRQRAYAPAQEALEASLAVDPNFVPALVDLAHLRYRALDYEGARERASRALSVDTYDPGANYYYGLANAALNRLEDARDGFEIAALSPELRTAAWNALARLALRGGQLETALEYASRSARSAPDDLESRQLLVVVHRLGGHLDAAARTVRELREIDELSHFARFERYLASGAATDRAGFVGGVRNEMPHETFLELSAWYLETGRPEEARAVLGLAPASAEVRYWQAYLERERDAQRAAALLASADATSPRLVFPFRAESRDVLEWAASASTSWRPKYYLALLYWSRNDLAAARRWFEACGDAADYAPFYVARAEATRGWAPETSRQDLERAARLDPADWRIAKAMIERALAEGDVERARGIAARSHAGAPGNYVIGLLYARTLLATGRPGEAANLLAGLRVLPYEGATDGRRLHREAHLMLAIGEARAGRFDAALREVATAREYPRNLGVGRPYDADRDERLEDWLVARFLAERGSEPDARTRLAHIADDRRPARGAALLVTALALRAVGREDQAQRLVSAAEQGAPGDPLVTWSARAFDGQPGPLPAGVSPDEEYRVLHAVLESRR